MRIAVEFHIRIGNLWSDNLFYANIITAKQVANLFCESCIVSQLQK